MKKIHALMIVLFLVNGAIGQKQTFDFTFTAVDISAYVLTPYKLDTFIKRVRVSLLIDSCFNAVVKNVSTAERQILSDNLIDFHPLASPPAWLSTADLRPSRHGFPEGK